EQVTSNLPTGRDELATTILGQGGTTAPPADVSKFAMAPPPLTGPTTRATWFHTGAPYQSPGGRWYDPQGQREGPPASGLPDTVPGIATPGSTGLGEYHQVTTPDGRSIVVRKTDVGPGTGPLSRGVGLDINAPAAAALFPGGPETFPS